MIRDALMRFALNQRPTIAVYPVNTRGVYGLPRGFDGAADVPAYSTTPSPSTLDLLTLMDKGQGGRLVMRFDIRTTFASADANILVAPAVVVAASEDLFSSPLVLVQGVDLLLAGLTAGSHYDLELPALSSIHKVADQRGTRYLGAGLFITSATIGVAGTLFTAGGMDAHLLLDSPPNDLARHPSGFTA